MLFRPTVEADLDRVIACAVTEPVGWVDADRYRAELARHQYRPEWTWVAEDGDRILARGVWWALGAEAHPRALDCVHVDPSVPDRAAVAAELIRRAHAAFAGAGAVDVPEWHLTLPVGWRDVPAAVAAVDWRRRAATRAGLTEDLERRSYEWTPASGVPEPGTRLTFGAEPDDDVWLSVFRRIVDGTLDTTSRRHVAAYGVDGAARADLEFYRGLPGDRDWWRLARTGDGRLVGFAVPSATPYGASVGYLGVLPEWRGNGYIDEILAEITRFHAARGARRVSATTDVVNVPMAAAFERGGYRTTVVRLILSAPH